MTEHVNVWEISETPYSDDIIQSIRDCMLYNTNAYLLDFSKRKYSLIEQCVYDIATFHFKRLGICSRTNYVEFWVKDGLDTQELHADCDEVLKKHSVFKYPLLSCVTYLNDCLNAPTIITCVDMECYKYKKFNKQTELFLSVPLKNKQITFDGRNFHGCTTLNGECVEERFIIAVNLWDTKPLGVEYFNHNLNTELDKDDICNGQLLNISACKIGIHNQFVSGKVIDYQLFNDLLYNNDNTSCYRFDDFVKANDKLSSFKFTLDKTIEIKEQALKLKQTYGDIVDDYNAIIDTNIELKYNRFLQRFIYPQIYTADTCRFIINECEKYAKNNAGWTTQRHYNHPTTDLPVDKISSIFGLVSETLTTILDKIKKSYGLTQNGIIMNVADLFVVKYSHNAQNHLGMHRDGSFISFGLLLSDVCDFEGGGTYFDDGITSNLERGDILIHSGLIKHSGLPISKGTRYVLVGFVNVEFDKRHI